MINQGDFVTVKSAYGNHLEEIFTSFFSNGWLLKSEIKPDYDRGQTYHYLTFEAGATAREVTLDLPNAQILK